jgi:hypothetical protein
MSWLLGKLGTLGWFLARPRFYGQALRAIRCRILPHPGENTRDQATAWCHGQAISTAEAMDLLLGSAARPPMLEVETERYQEALTVARGVPGFMGGPGDLDLLFYLARGEGVRRVLETGVAYGWSSLALLLGLGEQGQLFSTDMPYVKGGNEDFVGCVVPEDLRSHWTLIRLADRQGLPRALRDLGRIDLCHYDSDKTYVGRMWAAKLIWDALEPGGFFVVDDAGDNDAFRVFAEQTGLKPILIRLQTYSAGEKYVSAGEKYVGVLVKP